MIELIAELGWRSILSATGSKKATHPLLSVFGYAILGAVSGGLSLLIYKDHFIKSHTLRVLNIILAPILVGLVMSFKGKLLRKDNKFSIRLDTFGFGFLFAFTFAIIRYLYAK